MSTHCESHPASLLLHWFFRLCIIYLFSFVFFFTLFTRARSVLLFPLLSSLALISLLLLASLASYPINPHPHFPSPATSLALDSFSTDREGECLCLPLVSIGLSLIEKLQQMIRYWSNSLFPRLYSYSISLFDKSIEWYSPTNFNPLYQLTTHTCLPILPFWLVYKHTMHWIRAPNQHTIYENQLKIIPFRSPLSVVYWHVLCVVCFSPCLMWRDFRLQLLFRYVVVAIRVMISYTGSIEINSTFVMKSDMFWLSSMFGSSQWN